MTLVKIEVGDRRFVVDELRLHRVFNTVVHLIKDKMASVFFDLLILHVTGELSLFMMDVVPVWALKVLGHYGALWQCMLDQLSALH